MHISRILLISVVVVFLPVAVIVLALKMSAESETATMAAGRLQHSVNQLHDSLQLMLRSLDSLKSQVPGLGE